MFGRNEDVECAQMVKATGDLPQDVNFAIKTGAMRDFLDDSVVSYKTAEPKNDLKTADTARQARAYPVLISCSAKDDETEGSPAR